jgi:hypothetical protein
LNYNGGSILTKQQKLQLAQLKQENRANQHVLQTQSDEIVKAGRIQYAAVNERTKSNEAADERSKLNLIANKQRQ